MYNYIVLTAVRIKTSKCWYTKSISEKKEKEKKKNPSIFLVYAHQTGQPAMNGCNNRRMCKSSLFLQTSQTICLCHCLACKQVSVMFLVFVRNGTKFKITSMKNVFQNV